MCDLCFKKKNKVMNIDKRNLNRKNPNRKSPNRKNPIRKKLNKDIVRKNSKNKKMKVLKIYPNNWHYMIKINRKKPTYWWWNKTTNEVMLQGLKTLTKLTPNGNNLLFQINWSKNKTIINRTHKEAYDFIVGAYKESVRKKVSVHAGYETL